MKKINCFLVVFLLSILITGCSANNKIEISDGINVEFVDALFLKHPEEPSENRIVTILKASNETKEIKDISKISDIYFENCYLTIDDLEVDSSLDDVTGISSDVDELNPKKDCYIKLEWLIEKPDLESSIGMRNRETKDKILLNKIRTLKDNNITDNTENGILFDSGTLYDCDDFSIEFAVNELAVAENYEYYSRDVSGPTITYTNKTDNDIYIPDVSIFGDVEFIETTSTIDKNSSSNPLDWTIENSDEIASDYDIGGADKNVYIVPANSSVKTYLTFSYSTKTTPISLENPSISFRPYNPYLGF